MIKPTVNNKLSSLQSTHEETLAELETMKLKVDYLQQKNLELEHQHVDLKRLNIAKDDFISLASHQLRTPATGVKQYIGMLLEGFSGELQPGQQALLHKAYESNERQLRIISDLLKVAQIDAGKIKPLKTVTNIEKMIRNIISEQESTLASRHQTINVSATTPRIRASIDSNLMRMVFENIISNASKYSHQNTAIDVNIDSDSKCVSIQIADHGVGIEAADIPMLFEKFSRIDNDLSMHVGGSGLGLYWAKKIVDLHSGDISMQSEKGVGTIFTIKLPR